jgi:hypothetical protein
MDEEISIINTSTRNERIKAFFFNNKKILISISVLLVLILFSYFSYQTYKDGHREWLANKYNSAVIEYENGDKTRIISHMKEIIEDNDRSYSPLALYFLIDNNLIDNKDEINILFDILIKKTNLEPEILNLTIYKKALFNSNFESENRLLEILKPLINSESIWKSHALYLMAEYFYSKNEKEKSKEFFKKIISLENSNSNIKLESQKKLNRDFGE